MEEFFKFNIYSDGGVTQSQALNPMQGTQSIEDYMPIFGFENHTQNAKPEYNLPDLSGEDWVDASIKQEKNFFGVNTGYYIFTTTNGTTIKLQNTENVIIKENSNTGEIVIIGADNSIINTGNWHSKISIYNSHVDSITGNKYDEDISLYGSYFNDINTKGGNDTITMLDSEGRRIKTGTGEDNVSVLYSEIFEYLEMGEGNDSATFDNSKSKACDVKLGTGNDFIYTNESSLDILDGANGDDEIYINSSEINNVASANGDDFVIISNSTVKNGINSGKGNDLVKFENSTSATFDTGKGQNTILWQNSSVSSGLIEGENNNIKSVLNTGNDFKSEIDELDDISYSASQNVSENIASQYTNKELTTEEELQLLFIDDFIQNTQNMRAQFDAQENEDGILNDGYNIIKAWLDLGISKEDIQDALIKQEQYSKELLAAFNGKSNETFEEAFKRITGVEYNQENVIHWQEISQKYNFAAIGIQKAQIFEQNIRKASSLQEVLSLYSEYFGSEELGRQKLNEVLARGIQTEDFQIYDYGVSELYFNEKNELIKVRYDVCRADIITEDTPQITTVMDDYCGNVIGQMHSDVFGANNYDEEFIANYEKTMGLSFEDLQEEYVFSQIETFGKGNAFQQLIDDYCEQQESFADKLSTTTSLVGMGIIVVGGIATFVNPFAGLSIINAGSKVAFAGSLIDNGYDLIDNLTSENGLEKEELYSLLKETATELALYYSGKGIGKLTQPINTKVLELTGSESLALLAEVGPDAVLSLLADAMITGEVDITGEGISQLIQIIAGLAGARAKIKIDDYVKQADTLLSSEGLLAATSFLKSIGMPEKMLVNYETPRLKNLVFEKISSLAIGDLGTSYATQISKLSNDEIKHALELIDKGIPVSKAADTAVLMKKSGARINELINNPNINKYYIADLARLSKAEYDAALKAINERGITASSAIDKVKDLVENFDATANDIISSGKMRREITPEIETELMLLSKELSVEYKTNSSTPEEMFLEILFGEGVNKLPEDSEYEKFTVRTKGADSTLCKLIAKYEKGDLEINLADHSANIAAGRNVVTDAYGTRIQLKNLDAKNVISALETHGFSGKSALDDFTRSLLENSRDGKTLSDEYLAVLDTLKEQHNEPIFEALISAIENKKINLDELNNYGSELSSYFTARQVALLADAYHAQYGVYPKIVTKNTEAVVKSTNEGINHIQLMNESDGTFVADIELLEKNLFSGKAIKPSGYTTSQMTYKLEIDGALYCLGEFQIRGVEVNKFGDVEHIPYDIRQGKITGKDVEYKSIYDAITNMDDNSFAEYNKYLTQVYDYLRLKELGIDLGEMPSLESLELKYTSGESIKPDVLKELTYEGLLKYSH